MLWTLRNAFIVLSLEMTFEPASGHGIESFLEKKFRGLKSLWQHVFC